MQATHLFRSHTFDVLSMEQVATKSPHVCHVTPHNGLRCSANVCTHSPAAKSQILSVQSPETVARRAPLHVNKYMYM